MNLRVNYDYSTMTTHKTTKKCSPVQSGRIVIQWRVFFNDHNYWNQHRRVTPPLWNNVQVPIGDLGCDWELFLKAGNHAWQKSFGSADVESTLPFQPLNYKGRFRLENWLPNLLSFRADWINSNRWGRVGGKWKQRNRQAFVAHISSWKGENGNTCRE